MTPDDQLMDEMGAELGPLEVENLGRMANRPPDSTVDYVTSKMLELEARAKAEMERRDRERATLLATLKSTQELCEWYSKRQMILVPELRKAEARTRLVFWVCVPIICALCWREGWWIARWVWRLF